MDKRVCRALIGVGVIATAVLSLGLTAQPDVPPAPGDEKYELAIPPGSYSTFVFSCDPIAGGSGGASSTARGSGAPAGGPAVRGLMSLEGPQGYCTFAVPPGATVVIPVGMGDKPMHVRRELTVRLTLPAGVMHGFGTTADGAIVFKTQ